MLLGLAVAANVMIALGYGAIAIWVVPKFDAAAPRWGLTVAKFAGLTFFLTCAMTHSELALHAATGTSIEWTAPHFLMIHTIQAIAAPVFLVFAVRFMSIRIFNLDLYAGLVERSLAEQARSLGQIAQSIHDSRTPVSDMAPAAAGRELGHLMANAIALSVAWLDEQSRNPDLSPEQYAEIQTTIDRLLTMSADARVIHARFRELDQQPKEAP